MFKTGCKAAAVSITLVWLFVTTGSPPPRSVSGLEPTATWTPSIHPSATPSPTPQLDQFAYLPLVERGE